MSALAGQIDGQLVGWRLLARTDNEVLFGRGLPPELRTAVVNLEVKRRIWSVVTKSNGRPLRATRDGIRASSSPGTRTNVSSPSLRTTVLRVCATEQTFAGGRRADGRLLPPDAYESEDQVVLTMYVKPESGFHMRRPNPRTPVRVTLAHPIGHRELIDGAVYG